MTVAALFVRADSIYKTVEGVDCYDIERDARTWPGGCPVVAHPPCRAWGQFSHFAKPRDGEKELATWAVYQVRKHGGVLEHPARSRLWEHCRIPKPGRGRDVCNGWTLGIQQHAFGHRAQKDTILYIVGCDWPNIPDMPLRLDYPTHVIGDVGRASLGTDRPEVSKAEREQTPAPLATWLVELARRCVVTEREAA